MDVRCTHLIQGTSIEKPANKIQTRENYQIYSTPHNSEIWKFVTNLNNFLALEGVDRVSETQLQVREKMN